MITRIVIWGGTGQARVNRSIIEEGGVSVVAVIDDTPNLAPPFPDVPLYHGWNGFMGWLLRQERLDELGFCIAIGNPHGRVRIKLATDLQSQGIRPCSVIHPKAIVAQNAVLGQGAQLMAGAIVQPYARLGHQCIINTNASVDHECVLGDGVEIGPGATICGSVRIDTNGWIAAGATVLPRISVGQDAVVGAGSLVTRDVPEGTLVYGIPAKPVRKTAPYIRT